jgi:hypothetical protein
MGYMQRKSLRREQVRPAAPGEKPPERRAEPARWLTWYEEVRADG